MKKTQLKNKLKKFIFVLPILIIVFSLVCFPVSAATYINNYNMPISQPITTSNGGYIEVLSRDVNGNYFVEVYMCFAYPIVDNDSNVTDCYIAVDVNEKNLVLTGYGTTSVESVSVACSIADSNGTIYTYSLQNPLIIEYTYGVWAVRCYGNIVFNSISNSRFNKYTFSVSYGDTIKTNALLQAIYSAMPGEDYIVDSITDSGQYIEQTIDETTQEQMQNDNQNAADIQQNADENTDKILNSWENEDPVESGDTDNLGDVEGNLISGNQQAADEEMSNVNDNIFGSVQRLASSFGAAGSMFRQLTVRVPDFNVLIYFSLSVGIIPMIVGMTIQGLRSSDRASARTRSQLDYKRGYNAGFTKGKGG